MARTKQTARRSTGGMAPRAQNPAQEQLAALVAGGEGAPLVPMSNNSHVPGEARTQAEAADKDQKIGIITGNRLRLKHLEKWRGRLRGHDYTWQEFEEEFAEPGNPKTGTSLDARLQQASTHASETDVLIRKRLEEVEKLAAAAEPANQGEALQAVATGLQTAVNHNKGTMALIALSIGQLERNRQMYANLEKVQGIKIIVGNKDDDSGGESESDEEGDDAMEEEE